MKYLALLILLVSSSFLASAQTARDFVGVWDGIGIGELEGGNGTMVSRLQCSLDTNNPDTLRCVLMYNRPGVWANSLVSYPNAIVENGQLKFLESPNPNFDNFKITLIKGNPDRLYVVSKDFENRPWRLSFVKTDHQIPAIPNKSARERFTKEALEKEKAKRGNIPFDEFSKIYEELQVATANKFTSPYGAQTRYIKELSLLVMDFAGFDPVYLIMDETSADRFWKNSVSTKINFLSVGPSEPRGYQDIKKMEVANEAGNIKFVYPQKELIELHDKPWFKTYVDRDKPIEITGNAVAINPADVTIPANKKFKWYAIKKAPAALIAATKAIKVHGKSLWETIKEDYEGCEVQLAAIDLNQNNVYGIAISAAGSLCCGSRGCTYDFYEDGGSLTCDLGTDYDVMPGNNGVIASTGKFFALHPLGNIDAAGKAKLAQLFKYSRTAVSTQGNIKIYPGGGKTPDELGRILLTALKTNNKALWNQSIHPYDKKYEDFNKQAFDKFRKKLEQSGVADWTQVKFSRVTYNTQTFSGTNDEGQVRGEQVYRNFTIEFTYKSEFVGGIGKMTILSVLKNKYYIFFAGLDAGMIRK
ncbi:MAG: hypothetical protein REI78_00950 [Pedobacter sp.]|nr:hypothetical protein [Pedobacter sp.]